MTSSLDMNTPEHIREENHSQANQHHYVNRLQEQLAHNQTHRQRGRDYARIFRDHNTPAQWYQASPITRSIYFYDPQYQRYLRQQSAMHRRPAGSPVRTSHQSPTRAKPIASSPASQPQKSSRLPPIPPTKPVKDE